MIAAVAGSGIDPDFGLHGECVGSGLCVTNSRYRFDQIRPDKPVNTPANDWLDNCLDGIPNARVAVFGDFCVDAYWFIDPDDSEQSVETGLPLRRVNAQRYSLGGAGNIVANLVDLGVGRVEAIALIGDDMFGDLMRRMLRELGAECRGIVDSQADWQTLVYAKPCIRDEEQNRVDFGGFNEISADTIQVLADCLARAAKDSDIVVFNQQVARGVSTPEMIEALNIVVAAHPDCHFIVDSRDRAELYRGCILKTNAHEAARMCGRPRPWDERVPVREARDFAEQLLEQTAKVVYVTCGEAGLIVADTSGTEQIPGIQVLEKIDAVGAGDTAVAGIAGALACGHDPVTAARLANIAASVTVRKLQITGTASPDEIRAVGPSPDYVYLPELADDPRQARYGADTEIEITRDLGTDLDIQHAVFDHDGTISSLREGWEEIMEPVMVRSILGDHYDDAGEALYHKVVDSVRRFIDKTTGVQTLYQMQGLVELVREFGCVAEPDILDMHGYKAVYNAELLAMVERRIVQLERGERDARDFQIKNALDLLERLHAAGVKLYLASGTDQNDVIAEATALGYADLFDGRIFGAIGKIEVEAKRVVLDRILSEHGLHGQGLITFGDGPVEIRETRKRGGIAVGVASDEVRRFGLNTAKRTRLIRAGADLVIPDFSQLDALLKILRMD